MASSDRPLTNERPTSTQVGHTEEAVRRSSPTPDSDLRDDETHVNSAQRRMLTTAHYGVPEDNDDNPFELDPDGNIVYIFDRVPEDERENNSSAHRSAASTPEDNQVMHSQENPSGISESEMVVAESMIELSRCPRVSGKR
ncbi:MAG: hypothetical protein Q9166_006850 [cf. Caloplaca sp. 2 TL-2023]